MRRALLIAGLLVLALAWLGPLPGWATRSFSAHMTMHMSVVAVAAPLIALGLAGGRLDPMPRAPALFAPIPASLLELVVVWAWHAPGLHHFARHTAGGMAIEQGMFLSCGLLVWLSAFGGRATGGRIGAAIAGLLLTSMHMTLLGVLLGATTTYWAGRVLGSRALAYLSGPRLAKFQEELCLHAFRASIAARLLPVGNFTVINVIAGSMRIPFRAFFLGNVIGALPSVLVMTFFVNQLAAALRSPNPKSIALLACAVVVSLALLFGSFARGTASPESDIDLAVQLKDPDFEKLLDLQIRLEGHLRLGDAVAQERHFLLYAEIVAVHRVADEQERGEPAMFEQRGDLARHLPRRCDELVVGRAFQLVLRDADQRLSCDHQRNDRDHDREQQQLVA